MSWRILMPEVSAGADTAILQQWLKARGDAVRAGDVVAEIETDKAIVEVVAEHDGVLAMIEVNNGEEAPVGATIGVITADGEALPAATQAGGAQAVSPAPTAVQAPAAVLADSLASSATAAQRHKASPLARRLAQQHGVDVASLQGSGPGGRVVKKDVLNAAANASTAQRPVSRPAAPTAPVGRAAQAAMPGLVPHSSMRRAIAQRLTQSKQEVPHFYLSVACRMERLLALRAEINQHAGEHKITVNDMIVKAAGLASAEVPAFNAIWHADGVQPLAQVDIAVAVAVNAGLLTPVVRQVDRKPLADVSREIRELAAKARAGRMGPQDLTGGALAISNLGMHGIERFAAIINPPQAAILAVGAASRRPVVDGDAVGVGTVMDCTLSVDHRLIDGAVAANWLGAFRARIEAPLRLLMEVAA